MTSRILLAFVMLITTGCSSSGCEGAALGARGILGARRAVTGTPYQNAVSASSPTYWWWANEASGNLADHADTNPAIRTGLIQYQQPTLVAGETYSIHTNGWGIFYTLTTDAVLTGNFTLEWWYQRDNASTFISFWSVQGASDFAPDVWWFNGKIQVIDTNGGVCAETTSVNNLNIHYMVVTRVGTACKIYADGTDVTTASNAWGGSLNFPVHTFLPATEQGGGNSVFWQHGAIYVGTVLSGAAITNHWNAGH